MNRPYAHLEAPTRAFLTTEHAWRRPKLPLKRWHNNTIECGLIYTTRSPKIIVHVASLFTQVDADVPTLEYDSVDALIADGWVVD